MLRRRGAVGRIGELSQKAADTSPEEAWRPALPPVLHTLHLAAQGSCSPLTLRRLMPTSLLGGVKCSSSSKWMSPRRQACANSCPLPSKTRGQPRCRPDQGRGNMDTESSQPPGARIPGAEATAPGSCNRPVSSLNSETAAQQTCRSWRRGVGGCPPNA